MSQGLDTLTRGLLLHARKMVGSEADAEDIVQTAWLRALVHLDASVSAEHLRAWLFTVVKRASIDYHRHTRKQRLSFFEPDDAAAPPLTERNVEQQSTAVASAVQALPPRLRQTIELRFYRGYSYAEISEVTDVSARTVATRLHRAKSHLFEALKGMLASAD